MATTLSPQLPTTAPPATSALRGRARRLIRGRPADPSWVRPSLIGLLMVTAVLYLWGLGASGWANGFYAAAVQAGTRSWKAFLFGSFDAANLITVDKPPASLWIMEVSARIFGVNSWSILVPQALEGVAAVGLLYATVRRWFPPAAALLSGAVLALTPVATLMFRFNNPDALLVLVLVAGVYATVRAVERGSTGWLVAAGSLVGFGFLAKMLQAFLVVPAFALVYLIAGAAPLGRRLWQLVLAGVAMVASAGWWVALVELTPAADRPYVGGSQTNSVLELTFGYNGLGRLTGNETGSVTGGGQGLPGGGRWGQTGWNRMFNAEMGGQVAWLIPAALILLVAGLWLTRRRPRTDRIRAAFVLWGTWLVVTALVFSFAQGIIHPYYTVALAPAIGALVGMGAVVLWQVRRLLFARIALAITLVVTAIWSFVLLQRASGWEPWLRYLVLVGGLAAAVALVPRLPRRIAVGVALAALILGLAAPSAYALDTAATPHSGAIPSAGPAGSGGSGPGGAPGGVRFRNRAQAPNGGIPNGGTPSGGGLTGGPPNGGLQGGPTGGKGSVGGRNRGAGGLLDGSRPSSQLVALLKKDSARYTWVAAAVGSNTAAGYQLAIGDPVMAIGGFNGSDPAPTLAQFQRYVAAGRVHYFVGGGDGMGAHGGSNVSQQISEWVAANYTATTVGGVTVYDLTT